MARGVGIVLDDEDVVGGRDHDVDVADANDVARGPVVARTDGVAAFETAVKRVANDFVDVEDFLLNVEEKTSTRACGVLKVA